MKITHITHPEQIQIGSQLLLVVDDEQSPMLLVTVSRVLTDNNGAIAIVNNSSGCAHVDLNELTKSGGYYKSGYLISNSADNRTGMAISESLKSKQDRLNRSNSLLEAEKLLFQWVKVGSINTKEFSCLAKYLYTR